MDIDIVPSIHINLYTYILQWSVQANVTVIGGPLAPFLLLLLLLLLFLDSLTHFCVHMRCVHG